MLAIYLSKKEFETHVYEARPDMRKIGISAGRSINLALSDRGIAALREVSMDGYILKEAVPMRGRMVHYLDGQTKFLPYSGRAGEHINSISRGGLNIALMNEAEKNENVKFYFEEKLADFDCSTGEALIENSRSGEKKIVKGDTLFATDGAGSAVRNAMMNRGGVERFNFSQSWLEHGYKELHIPPGDDNEFLMEKNALHIWARRSFMMIALPNFDASFTCTLFLAHRGENSFELLNDKESVTDFFKINFADAVNLMPELAEDFFANPTGNLGTIKCFPWNVAGKALLIGDAAHAVVPFYGQGMNCSFEDCRALNNLIEKHGDNWEFVFDQYNLQRKENADAIADMAEENFYEMRNAVADPVFVRKRELEAKLEQTFPDYFSKYSLVTFREDVPYSEAKKRGNAQDKLLMNLCRDVENVAQLNLEDVMAKIKTLEIE